MKPVNVLVIRFNLSELYERLFYGKFEWCVCVRDWMQAKYSVSKANAASSHIYYMRIFTYNNIFIIISLLLASSATWKCNIAQVTQFEVSSESVAQTITDDLPTEV